MGLTDAEALATLRFSLGRFTTEEDIDVALDEIASAVAAVRSEAAGVVGS